MMVQVKFVVADLLLNEYYFHDDCVSSGGKATNKMSGYSAMYIHWLWYNEWLARTATLSNEEFSQNKRENKTWHTIIVY